MELFTNEQHRDFFGQPIRFHTEDLSAEWEARERQTGRLARVVLRYISKPVKRTLIRAAIRVTGKGLHVKFFRGKIRKILFATRLEFLMILYKPEARADTPPPNPETR